MSEVKHRGSQYFLLVTIILVGIGIGIYLKPKSPVSPKVMTKTDKTGNKKTADSKFEKVVVSKDDKPETKKVISTDKMNDDDGIDSWFQSLLKNYTASAEDLSNHHDVVIRYYRKPLDESKIDSLKAIGFYIHERPTKKALIPI